MEGSQRSFTNMVILLASFGMLALTIWLYDKGTMGFEGILTCTIAMMVSFGPVVALSSLSNNLNQTLASGERVLSLLEETPLVEEIPSDVETSADRGAGSEESADYAFAGAEAENVTFAYNQIVSASIPKDASRITMFVNERCEPSILLNDSCIPARFLERSDICSFLFSPCPYWMVSSNPRKESRTKLFSSPKFVRNSIPF